MTIKYFAAHRAPSTNYWSWKDHNPCDSLAKTVFEEDKSPVFTGLLDADGTRIFRVEEREPIGFIKTRDAQ